MKKVLFIFLIFSFSLTIISCSEKEESTTDTTAPVIAEVTAVTTPTNDSTPDYAFSSTLRKYITLFQRGGGRGKIISTTKVKVSKDIYKDWDLAKVKRSSFSEWYKGGKHRLLFYEGGFRYTRGSQYHPLVKRYNVFILYTNMMNDKTLYLKGNQTKGMMVSEKIVEDLQKERYELMKGEPTLKICQSKNEL